MKKSEQEEIELNLREFKMSWIKENKILTFIVYILLINLIIIYGVMKK